VRLFIRNDEKQFWRPPTSAFPVKNDALDGKREFFVRIFARILMRAKIRAFFSTCAVVYEWGLKTVFASRKRFLSGLKRRAGWGERVFLFMFSRAF